MIWKTNKRQFDVSRRGLIMGILNLTLDSFSDGGRYIHPRAAVEHALRMEAEGADIIDIGGESTRPGSEPVPEAEELARVIPVLEQLKGKLKVAISIDTRKPAVAAAAMELGAEIINDITGLTSPAMREVAARTHAAVVVMHMQGTPQDMQLNPHYDDVVAEVREFFRQSLERTLNSGIDPLAICFDPGIGFGKTVEHNLTLIRHLDALRVEQRPILLGVSRKSFIGKVMNDTALEKRFWPTVALTSLGRERGAEIFRVHDVKANREALRMTEAMMG